MKSIFVAPDYYLFFRTSIEEKREEIIYIMNEKRIYLHSNLTKSGIAVQNVALIMANYYY